MNEPKNTAEMLAAAQASPEARSMAEMIMAQKTDPARISRAVNTDELIKLAEHAVASNYNRQIDPDWLADNIDAGGTHVLSPLMIHTHVQGQPAAPHVRCDVMYKTIKMTGDDQMGKAILDVSISDYFRLPSVQEVLDRRARL